MQGYSGDDKLAEALVGSEVVIIPAGVPRKPGMTRDDLFKVKPSQRPKHIARSIATWENHRRLIHYLSCRSMLASSKA